jgi:hypothetical protein
MIRWLTSFALCISCSLILFAQLPAKSLEELQAGLQQALEAKNLDDINGAVNEAKIALGAFAGVPEIPTRYFGSIDDKAIDPKFAEDWWSSEIKRGLRGLPWKKNPSGDPKVMTAGLREAAWPIGTLARTAITLPKHDDTLRPEVIAGANWLCDRQHASGVFPFPVGPGLNPREKVGQIVARAIARDPSIVVDGWIAVDDRDGGLQFDNGLCGRSLISAWSLTKDDRYLSAAKRAGDWAVERRMVPNWNYNAFSAGLLGMLFTATGESKYLEAAKEKTRLGVLPGQMENGRWFDPHNTSAVYHNILLRELLIVWATLPHDDDFRDVLGDAIERGLDQAADETLEHGYTGTWTECFASGLRNLGPHETWSAALNVNLNASGKSGAPTPGFAIVDVIELNEALSKTSNDK